MRARVNRNLIWSSLLREVRGNMHILRSRMWLIWVGIASWLGIVKVVTLSEKGRVTHFVDRLEPLIRKKWLRRKHFPPLILVLGNKFPNEHLKLAYATQVCFLDELSETSPKQLAVARVSSQNVAIGPHRLLNRPGRPFELPSWRRSSRNTQLDVKRLLEVMNLDPDRDFVLLGTREASYYEALLRESMTNGSIPGDEVLPNTFVRNPSIHDHLQAARALVDKGLTVIRFGLSEVPLSDEASSLILDYSTRFQTPERDLLLASHCRFLISGASGIFCYASMHNAPVVFTNTYLPFVAGVSNRDRFIPQLLFATETQRLLSFREMVETDGKYSYHDACIRDGILVVQSKPEDIEDVVMEMLDHDDRFATLEHQDFELQQKFETIRSSAIRFKQLSHYSRARIGMRFLRKYQDLLL